MFNVNVRHQRRLRGFLLELLLPRNILFLILATTLGYTAHRSMLHMLGSAPVSVPLLRACDPNSAHTRCLDAESLLVHVCAFTAGLVGALHFLYTQMHYLQFPSVMQWRVWRLRSALRSSWWRCILLAAELCTLVSVGCILAGWAVRQPVLTKYTARVRVLAWRPDLLQWLELLLASASWLLSLHLSRHIAAVIFTHVLSFDAPLGHGSMTIPNTGSVRGGPVTVSAAALVYQYYLPNLTLGLDSGTVLIRYYAYQNLSHACQHSSERRRLIYGASAFDARGAEAVWRSIFSRCCAPLEALLLALRSPGRLPEQKVEHLQLHLWCLRSVSSLISKSKVEDQYGIVQSTNSIQNVLVLLLELHSAVEDLTQMTTRPSSFEGGYYERPHFLALHTALNLALSEITSTFFESMSYFKFPEHLISKLYTFLQFNE